MAGPASKSPNSASAAEPSAATTNSSTPGALPATSPKPARSSTSAWKPASTSSTPPTSTPSAAAKPSSAAPSSTSAAKTSSSPPRPPSASAPAPTTSAPRAITSSRRSKARSSRLGTDYVDVYHLHEVDSLTPVEETLSTLDNFVRSGKVRYIACSNFSGWLLMKSLSVSERYGWSPLRRPPGLLLARRPRLRVGADAARPRPGHRCAHLVAAGLGPAHRQNPPRDRHPHRKPPQLQAGPRHGPAGRRRAPLQRRRRPRRKSPPKPARPSRRSRSTGFCAGPPSPPSSSARATSSSFARTSAPSAGRSPPRRSPRSTPPATSRSPIPTGINASSSNATRSSRNSAPRPQPRLTPSGVRRRPSASVLPQGPIRLGANVTPALFAPTRHLKMRRWLASKSPERDLPRGLNRDEASQVFVLTLALLLAAISCAPILRSRRKPIHAQSVRFSFRPSGRVRGVFTGLGGGKNFSVTAGGDLGLPPWRGIRPTIEVRGLYPTDHGLVDSQKSILGGLRVDFLLNHRLRPYGDFLFGRGQMNYGLTATSTATTSTPSPPPTSTRPAPASTTTSPNTWPSRSTPSIQRWGSAPTSSGSIYSTGRHRRPRLPLQLRPPPPAR